MKTRRRTWPKPISGFKGWPRLNLEPGPPGWSAWFIRNSLLAFCPCSRCGVWVWGAETDESCQEHLWPIVLRDGEERKTYERH